MIPPRDLQDLAPGESSAMVTERVAAARQRAVHGVRNALLQTQDLATHAVLEPAAKALLKRSAERLSWSARGFHRVLRVARTVADLAGRAGIRVAHVAEAMQLRRGPPQATALRRRCAACCWG